MTTIDNIIKEKELLLAKYADLTENAYNYMESDTALSDIFEFEALQVMRMIKTLESQLNTSLV